MSQKKRRLIQKTVSDQQRFAFKQLSDFTHAHIVELSQEQFASTFAEQQQLLLAILKQLEVMNTHLSSITELELDIDDTEGIR